MIQALPKLLSFEEFLDWYPENGIYELHEGVIVELQPRGSHEKIAGFIAAQCILEIYRLKLPFFIPGGCIVRPPDADTGYKPDIIILDDTVLQKETLWEKRSTVSNGKTVKLLIEVASTNWRDDYLIKLKDYEEMGIQEYWIVDYLGLAATRYIGSPKMPIISIYSLVDGEYQVTQFRGEEEIISPTFPELKLTAAQIFNAMS
ncbi:Uma2 family endonuclease [Spirulina sp. 06S082]|uniref:Uma2 family endonuclease n=1 Tax=Spirulina sp. 06S082 TaxID=3110248 RepID=UPI002B20EDE4|nr:Uma2 family endonuclease [Spirulina sp. 06S082]MEA5471410.1 Uma2 family endonuclease [Spirulina sp. 06S082]